MELGKVICVADPAEAAARDEAMAAGVGGEPAPAPGLPAITTGFVHPSAPHAGSQFVQGREAGRFDEAYGNGWRLVVLGADRGAIGGSGLVRVGSAAVRVARSPDPVLLPLVRRARRLVPCNAPTSTCTARRRQHGRPPRCWQTSETTFNRE